MLNNMKIPHPTLGRRDDDLLFYNSPVVPVSQNASSLYHIHIHNKHNYRDCCVLK